MRDASSFIPLLLTASCLAAAPAARAQTITVDTLEDGIDLALPQTVATLPGPDGRVTFREACTAANNTAGPQTIGFAIPQSEWWLTTQQALLRQEYGIFLLADDATTVDFTTQTAVTGDTNPAGHEVGIYGLEPNAWGVASIYVTGDGCVIKGLDRVLLRGYGVEILGNGNRVIGCTISGPLYAAVYVTGGFGGPPASANVIGGTAAGEGNVLSSGNDGVRIDAPAVGNVVIGNVLSGSWHGASVRGSQYTTTADGNRIGGPTPAERNLIAGAGHYGEEGFPVGSQVSIEWATGTIIEGNFIGTTPDGMAGANQRGPAGIALGAQASATVIRGNVISGIVVPGGAPHYVGQTFGAGIALSGMGAGTAIEGNFIGTDAAGIGAVPNYVGVRESALGPSIAAPDTRVGGALPGQGNVIAFNQQAGVLVTSALATVRVSGNSIHSNGLLGIDLSPAGVTANDAGDGDSGPNGLQNAPVLASAAGTASSTSVSGALNSLPNQAYALEFFASPSCDPTGFGEGRVFLGGATVATDAAGNAAFAATLPVGAGAGFFVTATAARVATGATSEFSACLPLGNWADLGFAKAGSAGAPRLSGSGTLAVGSTNEIDLTQAAPAAAAMLIFGLARSDQAFLGGTLVPSPLVVVPLATDAGGALALPFIWPAGLPAGTALYFQCWIQDGAATLGLAASNGLLGVTE